MSDGFADEVLELAETRVRVVSWGAGPAVICIHGLGGGAHFFSALGPLLARTFRVVAPDLPGSGGSPLQGTFSFAHSADIVAALASTIGSPVCLLGHSMGTIIALEVVRRHGAVVAGMIAVGGLPEPLAPSRARIGARAEVVRAHGLAGLGRQVVDANFSRETIASRPEVTGLFAALFERQDPAGYAQTAEALADWYAPALPPLDDVRCLVITGAEDLYAPPDAARTFAASLPAGTRVEVMEACGHLPMLERPREFADIVSGFLGT